MKKKLLFALLITSLFVCIFAISASAITQAEADEAYYDKVYVTADGTKTLPLYEKEGETYYPLVWFAYDVLGEDGTSVVETKYVKARLEDITCYSEAHSQGRFNGVYYEYTDENGNEIVLNSNHAVLLNLRSGVMSKVTSSDGTRNYTNITIKTFEWSKSGYPSFSKLEAVYIPLSATSVGTYPPSSMRVLDIDRNHSSLTISRGAFQGAKIKEVYIPGGSSFSENDQFKDCSMLETIIFGAGTENITINGYTFNGANSLRRIYWLGTKAQLESITVAETSNGAYFNLTQISFEEYSKLAEEQKQAGKYLVYETPECYVWGHTNTVINVCVSQCTLCGEKTVNHVDNDSITVSAEFDSYLLEGKKVTACHMDGCLYAKEEPMDALFTCLGYSAPENGDDGISIKYTVNSSAIEEYKKASGVELSYGLFVTTKQVVGNSDIFDTTGNTVNGAITLDVTESGFAFIALKMVGFDTEDSKKAEFAIGAYAVTTENGEKSYSYLQHGTPLENEKYAYIKYNDFVSTNS